MPDEATVKALALEHCRRINARDLDGLLRLYSPDVRFEDPVGSGVRQGHEAMRAHATGAIATGVRELPGDPVATLDGRHAAVPVVGVLPYIRGNPLTTALGLPEAPAGDHGKVLRIDYVMVIAVGADGLIDEMQSYWGTDEITVADRFDVPMEATDARG
ncbi:nuclear transport factor 2 family protein [Paractinoplanes durhamensis]|uniref:SnoaL-like domain-containing protein n=1 Tax=Paractinoplanes durhamensis TaxID=113563 RepID=A0ABQ3ZD73_9ACTN|nr:nuclear transport factor 2 family protein [Actinoplanes durhamensis]GIE07803.1 hypothetical protein Adu01nite_91530 [Actinoplanes durhamensis]